MTIQQQSIWLNHLQNWIQSNTVATYSINLCVDTCMSIVHTLYAYINQPVNSGYFSIWLHWLYGLFVITLIEYTLYVLFDCFIRV